MQPDELYRRAATGDGSSLDELLARYLPNLHAYVHLRMHGGLRARESSMDVVQSVCRAALAERGNFDFRGEESFRAWLFTTALNKIRDKHRLHHREARDVRREDGDQALNALVANSMLSPSQDAVAAERARAVHQALAALPEDYREVISLARIVGLPHRAIAEVMDRSEEATRQLLSRALAQFAIEMQRLGAEF
jgi:RNA polymerase sigma-70 factor (subfamily 1)